ncbi:hypothetical protein AB0M43_21190 [Longispora sp. NPDC051575]|uniref:hypothetical protein n=1 Tax=Longispora sp. NPDC051575 TaxID=3154943 RepID=UPI00341B59A8
MPNDDPGGPEGPGGYEPQLQSLRSAVKWLITASAGVGAVMVAGLGLTDLGQLPPSSWRLYVALGAAVVTLATIAHLITSASAVLTHEWLTLASFTERTFGLPDPRQREPRDQLGVIEEKLAFSRHELYGHVARSVPDLHARLADAHRELARPDLTAEARSAAADLSVELRRTARAVVQCANYHYTLYLFQGLRARLAWAGVVVIAGIIVFAYAASPPASHEPVEVRLVASRPAPAATAPPAPPCPR